MTDDKRKTEPALKLDMGFGEALSRFVATKPNEVAESIERSKTKKPPEAVAPGRPENSKLSKAGSPGRNRKPNDP